MALMYFSESQAIGYVDEAGPPVVGIFQGLGPFNAADGAAIGGSLFIAGVADTDPALDDFAGMTADADLTGLTGWGPRVAAPLATPFLGSFRSIEPRGSGLIALADQAYVVLLDTSGTVTRADALPNPVNKLAQALDGTVLYCEGSNDVVHQYDLVSSTSPPDLLTASSTIVDLAVRPSDGHVFVSTPSDGTNLVQEFDAAGVFVRGYSYAFFHAAWAAYPSPNSSLPGAPIEFDSTGTVLWWLTFVGRASPFAAPDKLCFARIDTVGVAALPLYVIPDAFNFGEESALWRGDTVPGSPLWHLGRH